MAGTRDVDSAALGLETAVINELNTSRDMSGAMGERTKPIPFQQSGYLDENFRLRKELDEAREKKGQFEEMTITMAQDIILAQEYVREKSDALKDKEIELQKCQEELSGRREEVKTLSNLLREEKRLAAILNEKQEIVVSSDFVQEKQLEFETRLRETEEHVKAQLTQERDLRQLAEASLQKTKKESEKRVQAAEASLQEYANRMDVEVDGEQYAQRIRSLEAEVQDQRRSCEWFRKNSERLSRQIMESQAASKVMEQSEFALKRQLADLTSQFTLLQSRFREDGITEID